MRVTLPSAFHVDFIIREHVREAGAQQGARTRHTFVALTFRCSQVWTCGCAGCKWSTTRFCIALHVGCDAAKGVRCLRTQWAGQKAAGREMGSSSISSIMRTLNNLHTINHIRSTNDIYFDPCI